MLLCYCNHISLPFSPFVRTTTHQCGITRPSCVNIKTQTKSDPRFSSSKLANRTIPLPDTQRMHGGYHARSPPLSLRFSCVGAVGLNTLPCFPSSKADLPEKPACVRGRHASLGFPEGGSFRGLHNCGGLRRGLKGIAEAGSLTAYIPRVLALRRVLASSLLIVCRKIGEAYFSNH